MGKLYRRFRQHKRAIIFIILFVLLVAMTHNRHSDQPEEEMDDYEFQGHRVQSITSNTNDTASMKCHFSSSLEENLKKLEGLKFEKSKRWMVRFGFYRKPSQTTSFPVFVTASTDRYWFGSTELLDSISENLLPKYPALKVIYYDLGLKRYQQKELQKRYKFCQIRSFPMKAFPQHVSELQNYAWKTIIINLAFQEFGHVWYMDSSVRLVTRDLDRPIKYLKNNGILFFTYHNSLNVALHTNKQTFAYFEEDPCPFKEFGEVQAGHIAFHNNKESRMVLRKWVECALDKNCISPVEPSWDSTYCIPAPEVMSDEDVGSCHRFDQSVLSIILRRLYHEQNDYPLVKEPFNLIKIWNREK